MFQSNYKILKQTNGYIMGPPLSVTLADINMIQTETDLAVPGRPILYTNLWVFLNTEIIQNNGIIHNDGQPKFFKG